MIIRVISLKGGVGKSVISAYLVRYLSSEDSRILLIDQDNIALSSMILKSYDVKGVRILRDVNRTLTSNELKDYNYVIIDCPTLIKPELISTCLIQPSLDSNNITILVSDVPGISYVSEFAKDLEGIRILITNMVSPFPDDIEQVASKVRDLNFDLKVIIPFIPKVFMNIARNGKGAEIEMLKKLSSVIQEKDFHGQLLSPV